LQTERSGEQSNEQIGYDMDICVHTIGEFETKVGFYKEQLSSGIIDEIYFRKVVCEATKDLNKFSSVKYTAVELLEKVRKL